MQPKVILATFFVTAAIAAPSPQWFGQFEDSDGDDVAFGGFGGSNGLPKAPTSASPAAQFQVCEYLKSLFQFMFSKLQECFHTFYKISY
jgi:hypothetical protein